MGVCQYLSIMVPNTDDTNAVDPEVMASVDDSSRPEFVIADISRDEAWLSMRETDAPVLRNWR